MKAMPEIYDQKYVAQLFDEMSASYERMNYITSFGFSKRWRDQLLANAHIQ
jgi:ubiquinone/menaquinone biosynthesis C-methylase UbiE